MVSDEMARGDVLTEVELVINPGGRGKEEGGAVQAGNSY